MDIVNEKYTILRKSTKKYDLFLRKVHKITKQGLLLGLAEKKPLRFYSFSIVPLRKKRSMGGTS